MDKKIPKNSKSTTGRSLLIVVIIILLGLWFTGIPTNIYKKYTLQTMYNRLLELNKNNDPSSIYDELLLPSDKQTISKNDYIGTNNAQITSMNTTINSITINGDIGVIDRNQTICFSAECSGDNKSVTHLKKRYVYVNGKWYVPLKDNNIYCTREQAYNMPEEFRRAMSLVIQRFAEGNIQSEIDLATMFKSTQNCLDIQYSKSDSALNGAEGMFLFSKNSTPEDLQIFVSPSYSFKDDILTAVLLMHEMSHAQWYSRFGPSLTANDCYKNEATAFNNQIAFTQRLNPEEKASLNARLYTQSSQSVNDLFYTLNSIGRLQGQTGYDQALNFVKNDPFYQKECSSVSNN